MITYPVDPESKWAQYRISDAKITARNLPWPGPDLNTFPSGLNPDYTYLLQSEEKQPEIDHRLFTLGLTDVVDVEANTLVRSWIVSDRPKEDILLSAVNAESLSNSQVLRPEDTQKKLLLFAGLANRLFEGMKLTESEEKLRAEIASIAAPMWDNDARLAQIKAAIEADEPVDLDTGWKTSIATAEP